MIVKILRHQPELRLKIGRPKGYGGPPDVRDLRLVIRAPAPEGLGKASEIIRHGFWPGNPPENDRPPLHEYPALIYPCFDLTPEGEAVFRFDYHLWRRPFGRYLGTVSLGSHVITVLDLDVGAVDWRVLKAETRPEEMEDRQ